MHTPFSPALPQTLALTLTQSLALALSPNPSPSPNPNQALAWRPDLSVALNAIDFRGGLPFVYYHQVVSSVECPTVPLSYYQRSKLEASQICARSSKCQSAKARLRGEPVADPAARCSMELRPVGGHPSGGYEVTILGSGFDEFDANASTVRTPRHRGAACLAR